jgi:TonB family protein
VGTEVFIPGTYAIGSDPSADLRLEDASVDPRHALLYFQNGRTAIQDAGTAVGVYVNGHRVQACEIRPVDEVMCGPFVLKTRVLQQRPQEAKPQPSPEVAALLGSPTPQPPRPQPVAPPPAAPPQATVPRQPRPPGVTNQAATVPAVRPPQPVAPVPAPPAPQGFAATVPGTASPVARPTAAPPVAYAQPAATPVPVTPVPGTQVFGNVAVAPLTTPPSGTQVFGNGAAARPLTTPTPVAPLAPPVTPVPAPMQPLAQPVPAATVASARRRPAQEPSAEPAASSIVFADELLADVPLEHTPLSGSLLEEPAPTRPTHAPRVAPGQGAAQLYLELYWGAVRREARRFAPGKKPVLAGSDERAPMPLWGFHLPEESVSLAESVNGTWRVLVPPETQVERSGLDGRFVPVTVASLESDGTRRFLTLREGAAARLTQGEMSLVAYAAALPERVHVSPFKDLPWMVLGTFGALCAAMVAFLLFIPKPTETADFTQKNLPPVALRLIAPEPEKKKQAQEKLKAIKDKAQAVNKKPTPEKPAVKQPERRQPPPKATAAAAPENKALKALAKLSAAGPATNDLLAAVDKLGSGPGSKNAKTSNFKLSGLIGKSPIANAGTGTFGLGGGGKGGGATLGAELLRGKGGGGIGALGAGGVGKGTVGGTVTRATARSIAAQGSIDREGVAKVVNSHLQEVHACYERALLREAGLAGKVVLEWTISTSGRVVAAKTKSSTLRNSAVEACILNALKTWTFPPATGGQVIITYPFLFNSVGY